MVVDPSSESFLLYAISDDWTEPGVFIDHAMKFHPERPDATAAALALMRDLYERGFIEFGWLPHRGTEWTPWSTSPEETIHRIAHGFGGRPGLLTLTDTEISSTETVRANLTPAGEARLDHLGDPYETYGDPWHDDPYLNANDWGYPPFDPTTRPR